MAKASINFAKASSGGLKHNDRTEEKEPEYLLAVEHRLKNEVDVSAKIAEKKIKDLYSKAKENYQDKFGQKLQAKSYTWEAVINLNKEHTLEDVQRLTKAIEKETGFTSVQIAIHRDEGRMERGTPIYNLHAHVTFFTLNQNTGQQLYRKSITPKQKEQQPNLKPMNRERLSKLQDITAKSLGMERGKKGSKAKRLDHKQYKAVKQAELAKLKDLKEEIKGLRAELKAQGAGREDYAKLEALNKELRERIKAKDLTISDFSVIIDEYVAELKEVKQELEDTKEELEDTNNPHYSILEEDWRIANNKLYDSEEELREVKKELKETQKELIDTKSSLGDYQLELYSALDAKHCAEDEVWLQMDILDELDVYRADKGLSPIPIPSLEEKELKYASRAKLREENAFLKDTVVKIINFVSKKLGFDLPSDLEDLTKYLDEPKLTRKSKKKMREI